MSYPFDPSKSIATINGNPVNSINTRYTDSCTLSPHDKFLSTVLTSFIGSIVTGISGGFFIAFCTTWICWFATMRILVVGVWFCKCAIMGQKLQGIPWFIRARGGLGGKNPEIRPTQTEYDLVPPPSYEESTQLERQPSSYTNYTKTRAEELYPSKRKIGLFSPQSGPPTILGWAGWLYVTLYFPIVQVLWLLSNWSNEPSSGNLKLVRAIGISVTALPLTLDIKTRYAVMLEQRFGKLAGWAFTFLHAFATLALGTLSTIMLVVAVIQMPIPIFSVPIYVVFSTIWMLASFLVVPPVDGGMSPNSIATFAAGLAIGIFGGLFTSAPAFASMNMAASTPGVGLGEYLKCEGVGFWEKFVAIMP
jgi:hypothetical protein